MSILKEQFEELFLDAFDLWPSEGERPDVTELARMFDEAYLGDLDAKWTSFGWETLHMNGNDMRMLKLAGKASFVN